MNATALKLHLLLSSIGAEIHEIEKAGNQPRWPAGAPQGKGGQFAPVPGSGAVAHGAPKGAKAHPRKNDKGDPVTINFPSKPTGKETWTDPNLTAVFVPGGAVPGELNGVAFKSWTPPAGFEGWKTVTGQNQQLIEPPLPVVPGKSLGAGVIILEPDGRVWITKPTNEFGGYKHTFPKGTQEFGLSLQANAIKEAYEETGLKVRITGVLGDVERDTSVARYYIARRTTGTPADMGWESQAVKLVPRASLHKMMNREVDKDLASMIAELPIKKALEGGPDVPEWIVVAKSGETSKKPGAWQNQPRWPAGTPLGGQWMQLGAGGIPIPPKIGSTKNPQYGKVAQALYEAAQKGDKATVISLGVKTKNKVEAIDAKVAAGGSLNSHDKWHMQLGQYALAVLDGMNSSDMYQATAQPTKASDGMLKLSDMKYVGPKPGGSAAGAVYMDADGNKWVVKGYGKDDNAKNEVLAGALYKLAGVDVPELKLIDLGSEHKGGIGVASKLVDEPVTNINPKNSTHVALAQKGFAVDAWLANYDAVGLTNDNLLITPSGKAYRIDVGGALLYRATGAPKTDFGPDAKEIATMRDPAINKQAAAVFGSMKPADIVASAQALKNISDQDILKLVDKVGPGDAVTKQKLVATLIARKKAILDHAAKIENALGVANTPAAPAPAPAQPKTPRGTMSGGAGGGGTPTIQQENVAAAEVKASNFTMPAKPDPSTLSSAANPNKKLLGAVDAIAKIGDDFAAGKISKEQAIASIAAAKFGTNTYGKKAEAWKQAVLIGINGGAVKAADVPAPAAFKPAGKNTPEGKFDPGRLSPPPNFQSWGDTGKPGPSSKPHINAANDEAVKALYKIAQSGNVDALKSATFQSIDPETGKAGPQQPISQHPSQHVKGYQQQLINEIEYQKNPPPKAKLEPGSAFAQLDKAAPIHKGPLSAGGVEKLANYVVVGNPGIAPKEALKLPTISWKNGKLQTATYAKHAQAAWQKMPQQQRDAVKSYTGSGYQAINKSLWSGNPNGAAKSAGQAIMTLGHEITPGTMLSRKISLNGTELEKLKKAVGKVLQEPAVMSTAIDPGVWGGNVHFKMVVGQGVKGLYVGPGSNPSGGSISHYSNEKEMILPPNTRLLVQKVTQGGKADPDGFGAGSKVVVEVLILPTHGS